MNQTNVNQVLWDNLIQSSSADKLSCIILETISKSENSELIDFLDTLTAINIPREKLKSIIDALESLYICGCKIDIAPYLSVLYYRAGNKPLAKYYLGLSNTSPNRLFDELLTIVNECISEPDFKIEKAKISNYDFESEYEYNGEKKVYSIHSFSKNIGKNATILKTSYGAILFDCGAACGQQNTDVITEIELLEFFMKIDISPDDIIAVIISHAHLDHYGSISTLINLGIDINRIYIEDDTKALISQVDTDLPSVEGAFPVNAFFYPFQKIRITSFENGHILGSSGYIVTFDEKNVIYTGDYCLHDQTTVSGLNIRKLLQNKFIDMYGVDCLITETTYGKRAAPIAYTDVSLVFQHFVNLLLSNGFKVFIPSFAIGRSQEIALLINESKSVLIDGLAAKISKIYENIAGLKIFNNNTRYNEIIEDNKEDNFDCNDIIIASSGMLSKDSTSYNYVKNFLNSERKIGIIKTGYISSESYGNDLLNQWKGKNCRLFDISLSAHADYNEIITLIEALEPNHIVCIHGDGLKSNETADNEVINNNTINDSVCKKNENDKLTLDDTCSNSEKSVEKSKPSDTIVEEDNNKETEETDSTAINPYYEITQELVSNDSTSIIESIEEFLRKYDNVPKTAKQNINKNPAVVSSYYELYCQLRMDSRFPLLYESVRNIGPQKAKQAKHLKKIMRLYNQDEYSLDESITDSTPVLKNNPAWNISDSIYIKSSDCDCNTNHEVVEFESNLITVKGDYVSASAKIKIKYCKKCNIFFIDYDEYKKAIKKYEILIAKFNVDDETFSRVNQVKMFAVNPLFFSGYALETTKGGLKQSTRQKLISEIIKNEIMAKEEVIEVLNEYKKKETEFTNKFQINDDIRFTSNL